MLMYSPLSAYFDDVILQQPALSNEGKQRQPAMGDFTSPIAGMCCGKKNRLQHGWNGQEHLNQGL
jgi:hypothetical protein